MRCCLSVLMTVVPLYAGDLPVPPSLPVPKVQVLPLPHAVFFFHLEGKELTAVHSDPADPRP